MSDSVFINKIKRLADCGPDAIQALRTLEIDANEIGRRRDILVAGYSPDFLYVMLEGWAARYSLRADGSRRITGFLLPGDFCGIHAVCHCPMDHSIVAITKCVVGKIPLEQMQRLTARHPAIDQALWRAKLGEEAILRTWLIAADDALHSLSHLFCELFHRSKVAGSRDEEVLVLPITQEDIGDALNLTSIHVNRTIRRMREMGLIDTSKREIRILDPEGMKRAASFDPKYIHA